MQTYDGTASAALDSTARGIAWLVELQFASGTLRATTWPIDLDSAGFTWLRAGNALQVGNVHDSEVLDTRALDISLSVVDTSVLALAVGDPTQFRGRSVRLRLQVVDTTGKAAGAPVLRWSGAMESVQIERQPAPVDGSGEATGTITIHCGRSGVSRSRRRNGLRLTDAQQQHRYPGDTGYQYVSALIEKPTVWLSKRFQQV